MEGMQEQICAGCEFYEENYKKALDRFLLYKEKIMCTQTLIQKYERRKQHNQQIMRKLLKSRQNVAAVRERFMHYMERYMPLEKSYNELRAAHNDLEDKMHTQATTLVALQQHNKQLSALVDVQEKELNQYKEKHGKLEDEFKRKMRMNQLVKVKASEKHRSVVKAAVELAVILKDKGILPDSYKLCLRSWKKQLLQDMKRENLCDNGGLSPDKASSISSQDTGFDSSKSMSDDENPFDENVMRRKGAAGVNGCSDTSKSAAAQEKSFCDKSVNTVDIVRSFSSSCATDSFHNLRDIGVNTSLSMLTSDMFFSEVTKSDFKNSGQSPPDQSMENHDLETLPFDIDSQIVNPHWSHQTSIFSPVKGAVRSATAEKLRSSFQPPTSVEMPPSNACVDEYQSKFVQPGKLVFANSDSSKTIPPHLNDTCIAGKRLSVLFASEVPFFAESQSIHERDKREEEERQGGVGGGRGGEEELRGEEEELGEEEEEVGLGVGGGEEEEECYDDGCNDDANNISSPDHDKGRNLLTGREDVHNAWNRRMQTALCFKVPFRGAHNAKSRVESIFQEMKLFAPRLVSPMSPCSDEIPATNTAVSASPQMCSKDLGASALSFVKCDSFQTDFGVSQTCSNNDSVFQQQPAQLGNMKKQNLILVGKRNGLKKKKMSKKSSDQDTVGTNQNCKVEIEPLKRVCDKECPSKYSSVLAKFSIGKDVSPMHHSSIKEAFTIGKDVSPMHHSPVKGKDVSPMHHSSIKEKIYSNNILSDPKYTNIFTHDFVKSLNHLTSLIVGKNLLKFTKKNSCQRSRKLRKKNWKTIHSPKKPKKHSAIRKPPSSYSNIVESASGCFIETVNDSPISAHSVESTPEIGKFEERLTVTETVNCCRDKPNAAMKVSGRKSEISQLQCNTNSLAGNKYLKRGRSRLRQIVSQEVEKSQAHTEMNILQCERLPLTLVKQKGVQHESVKSNILVRNFQPEVDNQTRKSLENHEKDTKRVVKKLDSTDNCVGTVSNSVCSSTIPDTLLLSTNNTSTELKRKATDSESHLGYTELLGDLCVSDDSSPESINGNSELSQCVEADGSNDESSNESDVASHNFRKTDVPQKSINKICDKQYNSERNEVMFEYSSVSYSSPQKVKDNDSVVKYGETETNIPVECREEICVTGQSVDLLGQKYDSDYEVQKINLICEAGEPISEISTSLPASCNTDGKTKDAEVSFSKLNSGVLGSTSEVVTVNEAGLEMNSVSSSTYSTGSLAQAEITTDCATQVSVPASEGGGTVDCSDGLHDNNTEIAIQGSEVNTDKDMGVQGSLAPNEIVDKITDSTDTHDTPYIDSKLSKDLTGTDSCTNKLINDSETHPAIMKEHIKEKHCSNNKSSGISKDVKDTEELTMKSCLQNGAVEDEIGNHNKNCDVSENGKFEKELEEEITDPNNLLNEDLFAQKCEMNLMASNCNTKKSVINCSESEEQIVKEQQESNKDDIPVEKIPQPELDVSQQEVGEVKDTAETYCEEYYSPRRTKKRIAHKPKPQASGSDISSEDKNFKSPTKGTKKRTPKKTKPTTEDEQRHTETVNTRTHNSSSKHLGYSVHDTGRGLASLLQNVGTDSIEEKCTLETECSSTKVTENVNYVSEARKELKNEVESGTDAIMNTTRKKQLNITSLTDTQLEPSPAHLQTTRRSSRLKKSVTLKLLENGFDVQVTKRRKKLNDEKYSTPDSSQDFNIDSVKTEKCDDAGSSAEMNHVEDESAEMNHVEDECDVNKALLAEEPVSTVQNSEVEKLHKSECDTDDGAADPSIGGNKRKIKNETGDESSRKKLAPCLFEKQSCYQTENEAKFPVQSFNLENASNVSCKSEIQTSCLVPLLSENKCKEECAGGNISTSPCQQPDEGGSVTGSKSKTSLEETISNTDTGPSNGECIYVHNNSASDFNSECTRVSYAKGEILRKCLAIQQRNKFTTRRPTRKILNQQEVFVSHQLSQLLKEDFTNEVLNTAVQMCGEDDIPVEAMAVVRCVLKVLLQEDCNEIDRNINVRAPPLSVVEEKLLTFLITLRNRCSRFSTLINDFLSAVEYYVLNLRTTPEIDLLHILTRFHAALCRAEGLRERAQAFCYDTLYCLKRKCFPVVYTILTYYAEVLPKAPLGMSSPICVSIVYSIFTSMNQANDINLKIKPLITLLCRIYGYKLAEVLSFDLVQCFLHHLKCQNSKAVEVCAAITLLAKRNDKTWTLTQLIPKYLAPLIHEWRLGKINDAVVSSVIDLMGCVVKPYCEQNDVAPVIKIFKGILHSDQVTHVLKMKAALSLARQACHHFSEVAPTLFEWTPEGQFPDEFWEQMSNILSVKPRHIWITFLSTWEENTEEKRVGAVNN